MEGLVTKVCTGPILATKLPVCAAPRNTRVENLPGYPRVQGTRAQVGIPISINNDSAHRSYQNTPTQSIGGRCDHAGGKSRFHNFQKPGRLYDLVSITVTLTIIMIWLWRPWRETLPRGGQGTKGACEKDFQFCTSGRKLQEAGTSVRA
eukprot:1759491-Rhodomonas_salina.1